MFWQPQNFTGGGLAQVPRAPSFDVMGAVFSGTATVAAGLITTLVVLFYLLVSGETLLRRFVEILPSFAEKRQVVELTLDIERNMSACLMTVTLINGLVEGELVTPMLMARRFTINPVAVILALIFWYWMWGVPGAILAAPMLAITKTVCDDLRSLRELGHFLEG